jgi:hypothetical protein
MTKTRLYYLILVLLLVVIGGGLWVLVGPLHCPVTLARAEGLTVGMSRADVRRRLGGSAGDYCTGPTEHLDLLARPGGVLGALRKGKGKPFAASSGKVDLWVGDDVIVAVEFDPADHVTDFHLAGNNRVPAGTFDMMCWRLARLGRRGIP